MPGGHGWDGVFQSATDGCAGVALADGAVQDGDAPVGIPAGTPDGCGDDGLPAEGIGYGAAIGDRQPSQNEPATGVPQLGHNKFRSDGIDPGDACVSGCAIGGDVAGVREGGVWV